MPQFKMGRRRPTQLPAMRLSDYLPRLALPTPPATVDYTGPAQQVLSQAFLNDQLGDCVIAAGYHYLGTVEANAGNQTLVATNQQIIHDYSAIGGYVPGHPNTDQGCSEDVALRYWTQTGFQDGTKLAGYLSVNPQNQQEYEVALWLFESLYFGAELPNAWLNVQGPGFTWDVGQPNPQNGHAFLGVGYNAQGVQVSTWGMVGTLTHRAVQQVINRQYGGELYALITPAMISRAGQKNPAGLSWFELVSDFNAMGGAVPVPPQPSPTPIPPPAPPGPTPPPGPSPAPGPLWKPVFDAILDALIAAEASNPQIATLLQAIKAAIDGAFALGIPLADAIDFGFVVAKARWPMYAALLEQVRQFVHERLKH